MIDTTVNNAVIWRFSLMLTGMFQIGTTMYDHTTNEMMNPLAMLTIDSIRDSTWVWLTCFYLG